MTDKLKACRTLGQGWLLTLQSQGEMEVTVTRPGSHDLEIQEIRRRMNAIRERLEVHNVLEEERAYTWPMILFDEATVRRLGQRLKQELENLPPRFT